MSLRDFLTPKSTWTFLNPKGFTLTLHGSSIRLPNWLYNVFSGFIHPEMQALFRLEGIVEGDYCIGIKLNVKKYVKIGKKLEYMTPSQVKMIHTEKDIYLYLPTFHTALFRFKKGEPTEIRSELAGDWLKLYYPEANRRQSLSGFFSRK